MILRSIVAFVVGIALTVFLSVVTDEIFVSLGLIGRGTLWGVPSLTILAIVIYRTIYNVIGAFVIAKLAPRNPMKHIYIMGVLGTLISIMGAMVNKGMNLGPEWYCWVLVFLAFPSAWLGGWLYMKHKEHKLDGKGTATPSHPSM